MNKSAKTFVDHDKTSKALKNAKEEIARLTKKTEESLKIISELSETPFLKWITTKSSSKSICLKISWKKLAQLLSLNKATCPPRGYRRRADFYSVLGARLFSKSPPPIHNIVFARIDLTGVENADAQATPGRRENDPFRSLA